MAKLMAKHWTDDLNWNTSKNVRDAKQGPVIFGHHFPMVEAISTMVDPMADPDSRTVRWRVKNDPEIHEFVVRPDYEYDEPYTQVQALLVAIKLSC